MTTDTADGGEDQSIDQWLSKFYEPVTWHLCAICGALIAGHYREQHASFHGKRRPASRRPG